MKSVLTPAMAVLVTLAGSSLLLPGYAQLPPTNMGKYVHQPGDNQYSDATQQTRHGAPAPPPQFRAAPSGGGGGWAPIPAPPKPDVTLEPIAADEPVAQPGFPPLPDRIDVGGGVTLGGGGGGGGFSGGGGGFGGGGGGFGGGASGPAPGMAGGGGGGVPSPTFHQHYGHMPPGAFAPKRDMSMQAPSGGGGGGYYKAVSPPSPAGGGGGGGYYKARSPGSDVYNSNPAGAPQYTGASARDLKSLGREPKLNERQEQTMAPDAPVPVVVSQSTTQDLSLPEDEFSYRHPNANKNGGMGKALKNVIKAPLNSVGGVAGVRF